ncbi:MAG: polysaccharide biosynthesis C-terminal domain-containing protein [Calditrichaeota bacterium]|nr:polysaccharide biosynthesis C-terminal domain-containing protein [Calditrichota bacterium]
MSDRPSSGGGTFIYVVGSLLEGVFAMAFSMALVRIIPQGDFGTWRQFMSLANIVWNVTSMGLSRSLTYFHSTAVPEAKGTIARRTLWLTLGAGALAAFLFYFGLGFAAQRFDNPALAEEALLFTSFLLLGFPSMIINPLMLSANRRTLIAGLRIGLGMARLAALIGLLWLGTDLKSLLICMNVFAAVQFVVLVSIFLHVAGPAASPFGQKLGEQLRFARDVTGVSMAGQIAIETDKLIVSSAFSPERFAAYSVGARELPMIPLVAYSITDSISPEISRLSFQKRFQELRDLWHLWTKRTALIMYLVFALVLFQYREIITILYTAEYLEGAIPLLIIGCLIPTRVTSLSQMLLNLNAPKLVMYATITNLALITGLSLIFLRIFGLWGPALAVAISEIVTNGWMLSRVAGRIEVPMSRAMPWGYLLKLLLVAVLSGALALPVAMLLADSPLLIRFFAYGVVLFAVYAALVWTLRLVSRDDLAALRRKS